MTYNAVDKCIRNKQYSEAAGLIVKNYKLSPQLTERIANTLKKNHEELQRSRKNCDDRCHIAQEAHLQTIQELSSEGLPLTTDKSLHELLSNDEET